MKTPNAQDDRTATAETNPMKTKTDENGGSRSVNRLVRNFPHLSVEAVEVMRSLFSGEPTFCRDAAVCRELGMEGLAYHENRRSRSNRLRMTTVASDLICFPNDPHHPRRPGTEACSK
jgi:hypothetical protein